MRAQLPVFVLCIALACAATIGAAERGFPLITVYPPEVHKGGPQNFDVAQDARGVLYFGNLHGLMTYDGAWWRMLKLPDDQVALGVATDRHGRIGIGMVNDFGYLSPDGNVHSLLAELPADKREVGDVRSVCTMNDGFLFVAEHSLLLWDGRTTRVAAEFDANKAPRACRSDADGVFVYGANGLQRFAPLTPSLIDGRVDEVVRNGNTMIAAVRDVGFFVINAPAPGRGRGRGKKLSPVLPRRIRMDEKENHHRRLPPRRRALCLRNAPARHCDRRR